MRIRVVHPGGDTIVDYGVLYVEIHEPDGDLAGGLRLRVLDHALVVEPLATDFNSGELYVPDAEDTAALETKSWNVPRKRGKV